jgi:F-type H+-transporting ATPase subunit b
MSEIAQSLGIDVRQIITTVLGFGIFYWILARFAFGPFMKMLDDRRDTITSTFARLEEERKESEMDREKYQRLIEGIEDERHKMIQEGLQEAKRLAADIQADARDKAAQINRRAEESAERQLAQAKLELMNYMVDLSVKSAELALKETITDEGHRRIIRRYIEELSDVHAGEGDI